MAILLLCACLKHNALNAEVRNVFDSLNMPSAQLSAVPFFFLVNIDKKNPAL